jgi:hypothetical protein
VYRYYWHSYTLFNPLSLVKLTGDGGNCQTFLAVDKSLFPSVSCIVHKFPQDQFPQYQQITTAFINKVEKSKTLIFNHHPQIPKSLDFFYRI